MATQEEIEAAKAAKEAADKEAADKAAAEKAAQANVEGAKPAKNAQPPINVQIVQPDLGAIGAQNIMDGLALKMDEATGEPYTSREGAQATGRYININGDEVDCDGRLIKDKKD